jgi:flagellar biosynthetic protein FliR
MAGFFLGFFVKVLMVAIEIAGFLIGFELSLNNASVFDPQSTASNTVVSQFLSLAAVAVLFESDAHHYLVMGLLKSYSWLPCEYYIQDMNKALLNGMIASLEMGLHLCVPVVIMGTASYLVLGILSRIFSGLHIFFIMIPGQIVLNLLIFTSTLIPLLKAFLIYVKHNLDVIVK